MDRSSDVEASAEMSLLREKIEWQTRHVEKWKKPEEVLLFETIRSIDNVFCQELFYPKNKERPIPAIEAFFMGWGVNHALNVMVPDSLYGKPFSLLESVKNHQTIADNLLMQCGFLNRAEVLSGWVSEGLVSARLNRLAIPTSAGTRDVIVMRTADESLHREVIAIKNNRWMSSAVSSGDQPWEMKLAKRHKELLQQLKKRVRRYCGWGIAYTTSREIDDYFLEWGQVYLRRMWGSDLVGPEDKFNGNEFRLYLGVLAALSGRAQKHLCYASILKAKHPELDIRNLLTIHSPREQFLVGLAGHLDADLKQVEDLMQCMVLEPENKSAHLVSSDNAYAPVIRASKDNYILPMYGLEINPFFFLLRDLQWRYAGDWDRASNNREGRWIKDLETIFSDPEWKTVSRAVKLKDGNRIITDIDFIAFDTAHNELLLFQLKWQQPFGMDNRLRRSLGKNLTTEGSRWVSAVLEWLKKFGTSELAKRAGFDCSAGTKIRLFVIGRYNAYFSGYQGNDKRASWCDWNHFLRIKTKNKGCLVDTLIELIDKDNQSMHQSFQQESYMMPLDDLAIILNPTSEPT
jgi:hypothetical protein